MINLADTHWWTRLPYSVSPFLIEFNDFGIRYYSLMYILAFLIVYLLIRYRLKTETFQITNTHLDDFVVWAAMGILLGGRLGYVLFYNLSFFVSHPFQIFLPFDVTNGFRFTGISGMSYHGGLIGVVMTVILFCRKNEISTCDFSDLFCPAVPLGYTFGRLGNFFNSELYGRATTLPIGMVFPTDPSHTLRHPSQLYEAFFEGIVLFAMLWMNRKKTIFKHRMFGLYLIGYGLFRFFIEYVRMPDEHLNFVLLNFTMGQVLCALMVAAGTFLILLIKQVSS